MDLSNNTSLGVLRASGTAITELDLSNNKELTYLGVIAPILLSCLLQIILVTVVGFVLIPNTTIDVTHLSDLRRFEIHNTGIGKFRRD